MILVAKLPCKFVDRKTFSLLGVISRRIIIFLIVDPKQLESTHHFSSKFFLASSISTCHTHSIISHVCSVHPQSHTSIFRLPSNSQWSIMLSMERSLCCTFSLCNSNVSYTKATTTLPSSLKTFQHGLIVAIWLGSSA